jgi:hypothetical protein
MKKCILTWLCLTAITLNGLAASQLPMHLGPGLNYLIADHLWNGNNSLADVFGDQNLPDFTEVLIWHCCDYPTNFASTNCYVTYISDSASPSGWDDSNFNALTPAEIAGITLAPGQGAFINPSAPCTLAFTGTRIVPVLPAYLPCGCDHWNLLSRQTDDVGTYKNITGLAPTEGARVLYWDTNMQSFATFTFSNCAWTPSDPILNVGESAFFFIPCATNPCCLPPPAGMSAWWPFDETAGPRANDLAGTVNNIGTYQGSPTPTAGVVSNALCFNGITDFVMVTNQAEINFIGSCTNGAESFTLDAWIRANAGGPDNQTLLDKRDGSPAWRGYNVFLSNGRLGFQIACGADGGYQNYVSTTPDLRDGQWHFIAVTVARCGTNGYNNGTFYLDGNVDSTFLDPRTGDLNNSADLWIGRSLNCSNFYSGCLDELEIYKRVLTAAEIQDICYARSAGKCKTNCLEALVLSCATNKVVQCPTNGNFFDDPIVSDPCCGTNYTLTFSTETNGTACSNSFTRTWQVTDCLNRTATCTQTVTVLNANLLMIQCPSDVEAMSCTNLQVFYTVTVTNSCCTNITVQCTPPSGSFFAPGTTNKVHCVATEDCCSNTASCDFTVTVVSDTVAPWIESCPAGIVLCESNGCALMPDETRRILAWDNSGTVFISQDPPVGTLICSNIMVHFTITDPCSNATYCAVPASLLTCCLDSLPPGMVLWLTFDETNGATCLNSMGGNNGTRYDDVTRLTVATTLNSKGPVRTPGQYVNNCLGFDGANDAVIVPNYDEIIPLAYDTSFSMDAWVKWDGRSGTRAILDKRVKEGCHTLEGGYYWRLSGGKPALELDGSIKLDEGSYGLISKSCLSSRILTSNVWTHLAATVERGTGGSNNCIRFYKDGGLTDTFVVPECLGFVGTWDALWIGASKYNTLNESFGGWLDEIELFNRALTATEVFNLWQGKTKGKCHPFCHVPWVTVVCSNTVTVAATICNNSALPETFDVSFIGLTPAQCGLPGAVNWGSPPIGSCPAQVEVGPYASVSFPVTLNRPPGLYDSFLFGQHKTAAYEIFITPGSSGQTYSCRGTLRDGQMFISCAGIVNPSDMVLVTNLVLRGTATNGLRFIINDPTNMLVPLNIRVGVLDNHMVPETNFVSLNGQLPGIPVTNQITLSPLAPTCVDVWVTCQKIQAWTPFYVVLYADVGEGGAPVPLASVTGMNVNPPTVGPMLFIDSTNEQHVLSWDAINTDWILDSTFELPNTNWWPVNTPVVPLPDGSQGVMLPATNRAQFFRLRQ